MSQDFSVKKAVPLLVTDGYGYGSGYDPLEKKMDPDLTSYNSP